MPLTKNTKDEYIYLTKPKCPHCDSEFDIHNDPIDEYYQEGVITLKCGRCTKKFNCNVSVTFDYSTIDQEQDFFD